MQIAAATASNTVFIKIDDMEVGKPYNVTEWRYITTRYGEKLCFTLAEHGRLILPERISRQFSKDDTNNNKCPKNLKIKFKGRDQSTYRVAKFDIYIDETDDDNEETEIINIDDDESQLQDGQRLF